MDQASSIGEQSTATMTMTTGDPSSLPLSLFVADLPLIPHTVVLVHDHESHSKANLPSDMTQASQQDPPLDPREVMTEMFHKLGKELFGVDITMCFAKDVEEFKSIYGTTTWIDLVLLDVQQPETASGARAAIDTAINIKRIMSPTSRLVGIMTSTTMQLVNSLLTPQDKDKAFDGMVHKPLVRFTILSLIKAWLISAPISTSYNNKEDHQSDPPASKEQEAAAAAASTSTSTSDAPQEELLSPQGLSQRLMMELRSKCMDMEDFPVPLGSVASSSSPFVGADSARAVVRKRDASYMEGMEKGAENYPLILAVDKNFKAYFKYDEQDVKDRDVSCLFGPATDVPSITRFFSYHFGDGSYNPDVAANNGGKRANRSYTTTSTAAASSTSQQDLAHRYLYMNLYSKENTPFSCRLTLKFLGAKQHGIAILIFTAAAHLAYCRNPKMFACLHPLGAVGGRPTCKPSKAARKQAKDKDKEGTVQSHGGSSSSSRASGKRSSKSINKDS